MSVELLVEAAEDDRLRVDVFLRQRRPESVGLRVLAGVVQVVAAPTAGKNVTGIGSAAKTMESA